MSSDPSIRLRRSFYFPIFVLLASAGLFFLLFFSNTLTDRLVSYVCASAFGRPVVLHGAHFEFPTRAGIVFRVREIDLRPMWQGTDSAASRFIHQHDLDEWLELKDTLWILKSRRGRWFLRLLNARAGEISIKGGLCLDRGRIVRWNGAIHLPRSLSERFPQIVEKRFAQDALGRRLFKMTWAGGQWRLWGRSGPVLEAKWQ